MLRRTMTRLPLLALGAGVLLLASGCGDDDAAKSSSEPASDKMEQSDDAMAKHEGDAMAKEDEGDAMMDDDA